MRRRIGAPYVVGSATSRAAAIELVERGILNKQERRIFDALLQHDGQTRQELEKTTGMGPQSVTARCTGLIQKGVIKPSGELRSTKAGMPAEVLIIGVGGIPIVGTSNARRIRPSENEIRLACATIIEIANAQKNYSNDSWKALVKLHRWLLAIL